MLANPLPLNGTTTVEPIESTGFSASFILGAISPAGLPVTFTTMNGQITAWSVNLSFCPCYGTQTIRNMSMGLRHNC